MTFEVAYIVTTERFLGKMAETGQSAEIAASLKHFDAEDYVEKAYEAGRANKLHELLNEKAITANDIADCLNLNGIDFDLQYLPSHFRLRSGVQFLIESPDLLKDEYMNNEHLKIAVEDFDGEFSRCERSKRYWYCAQYPFWGVDGGENGISWEHTVDEVKRPDDVPECHWWWWTEKKPVDPQYFLSIGAVFRSS